MDRPGGARTEGPNQKLSNLFERSESKMSNQTQIPDRRQREQAETTFDRNVVVVAGAGTGKTTLLVNRLIHILIKEPHPVAVTHVVALTFTNKAATEMKVRLRERLIALARSDVGEARPADGGAVTLKELRERYRLTAEEIQARAGSALQDLEKAQIGTLHSFAAHLLRLHPLESAVDPVFQEDDGSRFEEHFSMAWDLWIARELSRQGSHHHVWRPLLRTIMLEDIRTFARALCGELVNLGSLQDQLEMEQVDPRLMQWLQHIRDRAQALLNAHDRPKRRKVEHMLAATISLAKLCIEQGPGAIHERPFAEQEWLAKDVGTSVAGWDTSEFDAASRLINIAQQIQYVNKTVFKNILTILSPFISEVRASFVQKGWLSFDGLLARARALLRDHPAVRERIKREYRAVLVDEFQDTDPVQYEIILAVSERHGCHATNWQEMALEPGKLFIVGDPKQSIYAFRRADIEAFDRVVQKIESDQGMLQTLTTNFRSDAAVLGPVNDLFDRLFERRPHIQPANVRLEVRPQRRPGNLDAGVRLQLVRPGGDDEAFDAAGATRAEAEALARWLKEDVFSLPAVKFGHVALLFRKLTQADTYLDALRRYRLPYVIEGEKHFYRRQEVIDFVNVLRLLENPHDWVALVGVLRSPLGGLTDRDLYELREAELFDYRDHDRLVAWAHPRSVAVRRLYCHLADLRREVFLVPLAVAVQLVFDRLPILEVAAASLHGEQAVANLLKVKQTAAGLSDRPHLTLSGLVDFMVARIEEQPDEAESPLAEESTNAIQVLTIHKAKGLEYPIVVLPGLHQGIGRERSLPLVSYDWSSGLYGLSLGTHQTLSSLLVREKVEAREEAERRRVLYVGMTRAKELLVLSGSVTERAVGETVLSLLQEVGEGQVGLASTPTLTIGRSAIPHIVVHAPDRKWGRRPLSNAPELHALDSASIALLWHKRTSAWTQARATPLHVSPSALMQNTMSAPGQRPEKVGDSELRRLGGIMAHHILERWDFAGDPSRFIDQIDATLQRYLTNEQLTLAPALSESLQELFTSFGRSEIYAMLRASTILGREVPFVMSWGKGQVMEGVVDLIYRLDGGIWIADYKTDAVPSEAVPARAEAYRQQAEIYQAAVQQSLGISSVAFQFIFLRPSVAIEM
jgi:ATP-dependent helicase/nuclease subunit A